MNPIDLPIIVKQIISAADLSTYGVLTRLSKIWHSLTTELIKKAAVNQHNFEAAAASACKLYLKAPTAGWPLRMFVTAFRHLCQVQAIPAIERFIDIANKSGLSHIHFRSWHADVGLLRYDQYYAVRDMLPKSNIAYNNRLLSYSIFEAACMHDDDSMAAWCWNHSNNKLHYAFVIKYDAPNILHDLFRSQFANESIRFVEDNNFGTLVRLPYFRYICCLYPFGPKCLMLIRSLMEDPHACLHEDILRLTVVYNSLIHNRYDVFTEFMDKSIDILINKTLWAAYFHTSQKWKEIMPWGSALPFDEKYAMTDLFKICDLQTLSNLINIYKKGELKFPSDKYNLNRSLLMNKNISVADKIQLIDQIQQINTCDSYDISLVDSLVSEDHNFDWGPLARRLLPNFSKIINDPLYSNMKILAHYRYDPNLSDLIYNQQNIIGDITRKEIAYYACIHNRTDLFEHMAWFLQHIQCPICKDPCDAHLRLIKF